MKKLGIAIYPEKMNIEDMKKYVLTAHKNGFKIVWTALLQIENLTDNLEENVTLKKYKEILKFCKEKGMETVIDVNSRVLKEINFSSDLKIFHDLYIDTIRFDSPLPSKTLADMTYNQYKIKIELNMDNNDYLVDDVIFHKAATDFLSGSHNFYPQKGCGITKEYYVETSKKFKKFGLETTSFISTKNEQRIANWAVDDYCCTVENLRGLDVITQANYLWSSNLTDNIIICNAYASDAELEALGKLNPYILSLQIQTATKLSTIEKEILFNEIHFRRADINPTFIRSTMPRLKFKSSNIEQNNIKTEFLKGSVLIGNNNFDLYKGEVQICLQDIEFDNRKNQVAYIHPGNQILLDNIDQYTKFTFILKNDLC